MDRNEASVIRDINERGGPVYALIAVFMIKKRSAWSMVGVPLTAVVAISKALGLW